MAQKILQSAVNFWHKLEGWKTIIGLFIMQVEARVDLPQVWWVQILIVVIYMWTGYSILEKVNRIRKVN